MTVSYQYQVANSTRGGFTRLLFMWRGSLYKLIYRELLLFLILFAALSAVYRHLLNSKLKKDFEQIVIYCDNFINLIPLSFVLGFYVSYVAQRWWQQYQAIPWPDKVMHLIALYVTGNDEYSRMLRRGLMRYLNLSLILVLRSISSAVKKRFPTLDHVVDSDLHLLTLKTIKLAKSINGADDKNKVYSSSVYDRKHVLIEANTFLLEYTLKILGFMTSLELELFLAVPSSEFNTYWIPATWFINLLKEARQYHRIPDPQGLKLIMEEFSEFRTKCGLLWSFDWISIPLVYTQVVTLATYSFFAVALIARQYIDDKEKQFQLQIDIYIPVFTILQFFFFMGLLKVAEQLINPFGDDDEDFELNWIIDRHTKVSYLGVDTLMNRCPPLVKDIYFDAENLILPYTEAAAAYKKKTYRGSVANMTVPEEQQTMFLPNVIEEEEEDVKHSLHTSTINLATHASESPPCERRQISSQPETHTKTDQSCPETVLQFDISEPSSERSKAMTETMKKFSSLTRSSTSRFDPNRKPFFTLTKSPKVALQPWPSASSLARSTKQIIDTPVVYTSDVSPWKEYTPKLLSSQSLEITPNQSPEAEKYYDFENVHPPDNLYAYATDDSQHSPQSQCHHTPMCHLQLPETNIQPAASIPPKTTSVKYPVRKYKSMVPSKRKGIQWKQIMKMRRRRTADDIPRVEEIIPHTRSSPNLKQQTESIEDTIKNISDEETDSSTKEE